MDEKSLSFTCTPLYIVIFNTNTISKKKNRKKYIKKKKNKEKKGFFRILRVLHFNVLILIQYCLQLFIFVENRRYY